MKCKKCGVNVRVGAAELIAGPCDCPVHPMDQLVDLLESEDKPNHRWHAFWDPCVPGAMVVDRVNWSTGEVIYWRVWLADGRKELLSGRPTGAAYHPSVCAAQPLGRTARLDVYDVQWQRTSPLLRSTQDPTDEAFGRHLANELDRLGH